MARKEELTIPICKPGCRIYHRMEQAAALMSVSMKTVYRLMKEGLLPYKKGTQSRLVNHRHIDYFMRGEPFEQVEHGTLGTPKKTRGETPSI